MKTTKEQRRLLCESVTYPGTPQAELAEAVCADLNEAEAKLNSKNYITDSNEYRELLAEMNEVEVERDYWQAKHARLEKQVGRFINQVAGNK